MPEILFGRERECATLEEMIADRRDRRNTIVVHGQRGIGKTAVIAKVLLDLPEKKFRQRGQPVWIDVEGLSGEQLLRTVSETMRVKFLEEKMERGLREIHHSIVVIDGLNSLSQEHEKRLLGIVFNFKRVETLIIATSDSSLFLGSRRLEMSVLTLHSAMGLLAANNDGFIPEPILEKLALKANGSHTLLGLIAGLLKKYPAEELAQRIDGQFYAIGQEKDSRIVQVTPQLVTLNTSLANKLKRCPEAMYELTSRQFEELVAELVEDMGWKVTLTKQTRDGGKDLFAKMDTGLGEILCLVEAKKYAPTNPVGVHLVRELFGTLCHEKANSAILVTSSYFSPDAKEFRAQHEHQLQLREYIGLTEWLMQFPRRKATML